LARHGPRSFARAAFGWLRSARTWPPLWSAPFRDQALLGRWRQHVVAPSLGLLPIAVLLASQGLPRPGGYSSFPAVVVLAAGWLLRCRLLMAVLGIAWATQVAYAALGELASYQVAARVVAFGAIALTCRLALHGLTYLRQARHHDMSTMLLASQAMGGSFDLGRVAAEAVRAAARTVARPGRAGGRPAVLLCVADEAVTLVAACDAMGVEVPEAAGRALGAAPAALLQSLASGRPGVVAAGEMPSGLCEAARVGGGSAWALAWVPVAGAVFGALAVASRHPGELGGDELRLLDGIARMAGLAVATALEHDAHSELESRLRHSVELALGAGRSLEPADVVARTLVKVAGALDANRATLARLEDAELVLESTYRTGGEPVADGRRFPADLVAAVPCLARALASQRPVTSGPLEAESGGRELAAAMADGRHTLVFPMFVAAGMTCLLVLARNGERPFAAGDLARLQPMGDVALLVLRNAYLYASAERARLEARTYSGRLQLAIEAAEDIGSSPELSRVLEGVLRRAVAVARADRGSISSVVREERMVVEYEHDLFGAELRLGATWLLSHSALASEAVGTGRPVRGGREPALPGDVIVCPLMLGRQLVGVLELGRQRTPFGDADLLTLQPFATLAALLLRYARLLAEARQVGEAKSSFLNLAAHELRTPLAVIRGYLSMLEDGTYEVPADVLDEVVTTLVVKAGELDTLVEALLTMAKLDVGALRRSASELDIADTVRQALDRVTPRARIEGARIEARLPDRVLRVRADRDHLARILDNLLNNALTYSPQPADVVVAVRAGDEVEIVVRDHGLGIPADQHGRVFERFHRLDGEGSRFSPGLGLGLSISRELAHMNEGSLHLEGSEPGQGSTFVLRLPMLTAS
jgi:signal transduction histidine kinase